MLAAKRYLMYSTHTHTHTHTCTRGPTKKIETHGGITKTNCHQFIPEKNIIISMNLLNFVRVAHFFAHHFIAIIRLAHFHFFVFVSGYFFFYFLFLLLLLPFFSIFIFIVRCHSFGLWMPVRFFFLFFSWFNNVPLSFRLTKCAIHLPVFFYSDVIFSSFFVGLSVHSRLNMWYIIKYYLARP